MDCKTARVLLEFDRPASGEIDAVEHEALQSHIAECPDCGPIAHAERRADHEIGKVMRDLPVPPEAAARLLERLRSHRHVQKRRRFLRLGLVAATAAAVLVATAWLTWQKNLKTRVDLEAATTEHLGKTFNPQPSTVENWFRSQGLEAVAPPDFNYALLKDYDVGRFQGKAVPYLYFQSEGYWAKVFLLSTKQFERPELDEFPGSGCNAVWRAHPTNRNFAYVVIYNGGSLNRFLSQAAFGST